MESAQLHSKRALIQWWLNVGYWCGVTLLHHHTKYIRCQCLWLSNIYIKVSFFVKFTKALIIQFICYLSSVFCKCHMCAGACLMLLSIYCIITFSYMTLKIITYMVVFFLNDWGMSPQLHSKPKTNGNISVSPLSKLVTCYTSDFTMTTWTAM